MATANLKKNVVIVGGGGAGAQIARTLSQQLSPEGHSITLIESREYYLHYPGALRTLVLSEGKLEERVLVPYDKLFINGNGTYVRASVNSISHNGTDGGTVSTDSGVDYPYDVLVLASGSLWEGPLALPPTRDAAIAHINSWREKFKNSNGVAIVGGGAVGSELAGEIRDVYPEKKITIVQKSDHLLTAVYPNKFRSYVDKGWKQRDITLVLNDELNEVPAYPATSITTQKGVHLDADLVVPTRGGSPNTGFISSLGKDVLASTGHVKVDPSLQVQGFPGVFAAGDIIDWKEVKQVAKYAGHGATIVANIKHVLAGNAPSAIYKSMFELIVLTNGAGGGATFMNVLWGLSFGNWFTRTLKSKDLFITKTAQGLGY